MKNFSIFSPLTMKNVEKFNYLALNEDIKINVNNTRGMRSNIISKLSNNICISVRGGLNPIKSKFNNEHYQSRTYYSPSELACIIDKFEKIEREINPMWSDLEKAMFVYKTLCEFSNYDENEFNGKDASRNLLGMITGKSVCAGYAMIYKEAMERIGIKCHYQNKQSHHAWNVLEIDEKYYPVELTWDVCNKKKNTCNFFYFGRENADSFYSNKHHDISSETEEKKFNLEKIPDKKLIEMYKKINENRIKINSTYMSDGQEKVDLDNISIDIIDNIPYVSNLNSTFIRDDGSGFLLLPTGISKKDVKEYIYAIYSKKFKKLKSTKIYSEMDLIQNDESLRAEIANSLISSKRITNKINSFNGYIGYIEKGNRELHYDKSFEEDIINKFR